MPKFADEVGPELHEGLVLHHAALPRERLQCLACGVPLQRALLGLTEAVLETRHHLHHAEQDIVGDRVRRALQHPEHDVHVPVVVRGVLLCENRYLEDQLLLQEGVTLGQEVQQLVDDLLPVLRPAKGVEQVEGLAADRDVRLVHLLEDEALVPLQVLMRADVRGQPCHRLQAKVPDVRISGGDECAEEARCGARGLGIAPVLEVNHEVHGFEED
mmetsp:Transcript_73252/g.218576  ORF Transcript_73252/g.218576 Transcript_73252/m.218576 type:complete len:215 (+) Transcript_73252:1448-2092(+)